MSFWDEHDRAEDARRAEEQRERDAASKQNKTWGVCALCRLASDDVLIGVCADCAPKEPT